MKPSSPNAGKPASLTGLLRETQDAYARLLASIERALEIDGVASPDLAEVRDHHVQRLMGEADGRLEALRQRIHPWSQKRKSCSAKEADEVDRSLDLLEKSLNGLQSQIKHRLGALEARKRVLQDAMGKLGDQRHAFKGYLRKEQGRRRVEKKA